MSARLILMATVFALSGCADVGQSFGDTTQAPAPGTDAQEGGAQDLPAAPTPDTGSPSKDSGPPASPDPGPTTPDPGPAEDDGPIDPNAPWVCEDDGFIEPIDGASCDWTWECDAGTYTISCTLQATTYKCFCKKGGAKVGEFYTQEPCDTLETRNVANTICDWKLPL